MASLTLRNIPDGILVRIRLLSEADRRSLNNEILIILENGMKCHQENGRTAVGKDLQLDIWEGICGKWEDERTSEEIISEIYAGRTKGRKVSL